MTRARSVSKLINSNILTIDDTNNNRVGIGSTIPNEKLDVVGVVSATTFIGEGVGIGTTANEYELNIVGGVNVSGIVTAQSFSGDGSLLTDLNLSAGGWTNDGLSPILFNTSLTEVGIGTSVATGSNLTVGDAGVAGTSLLVNNEARFAGIITGTDATFTNVVKVGTAITVDATSGIITATGVNATGVVTATTFVGNVTGDVTGNVTGNADTATSVNVTANNSTDETVYPVFVDGSTGTQGAETDTGLTYNPSSGTLTATTFSGAVTGDVTGNADTATTATNAQGLTGTPDITVNNITAVDITATGTLTYEDVTNVDSVGIVTARNGIEFGVAGAGGTITSSGDAEFVGVVTATKFSGDGSTLTGLAIDITSSLFF